MNDRATRQDLIVTTLTDAFEDLMRADPRAFRTKFRKMAADPFAFYRGSACLFYADMAELEDRWADERTSRVWIHGDLHAENFGTYMDGTGRLTFDINDFDEAYVGHFSWDLRRFVTSLALLCWRKAFPERTIRALARAYLSAYLEQVQHYAEGGDNEFALHLGNTRGTIHDLLQATRARRRSQLLDSMTVITEHERRFREGGNTRRLDDAERARVEQAFTEYLGTIPAAKRSGRDVYYTVKDIVGKQGFGIGSAGLPAYNVLIEGFDEAQENDIVLTMKQGNVAAPSRIVTDERIRGFFAHDGHRTVMSQRALQVHTDQFLGYTSIGGVGFVVDELSPYTMDLSWDDITEPAVIEALLLDLGRATAKIHCASDQDSDHSLVPFQTEQAITAVVQGRQDEFIDDITEFAISYSDDVRRDRALFIEAFREGNIGGVAST